MKAKILAFVVLLSVFSTSFYCKSQTRDTDNKAVFRVDAPPNMRATPDKFESKEYQFPLKRAYVMEGSNTGIEIEFQQKEGEKNTLSLFFFLPSGNTFKVYAKDGGFDCKIPEIPCTITNEDFKGIKSARRETDLHAYIYMQRNIRLAPDHSSVESVYFEIFSIDIKDFNIRGNNITFNCTFTGSLSEKQLNVQDNDYKISGEFRIKDFELGEMLVDD